MAKLFYLKLTIYSTGARIHEISGVYMEKLMVGTY